MKKIARGCRFNMRLCVKKYMFANIFASTRTNNKNAVKISKTILKIKWNINLYVYHKIHVYAKIFWAV